MSSLPTSGFFAERSKGVCFSLLRIVLSAPVYTYMYDKCVSIRISFTALTVHVCTCAQYSCHGNVNEWDKIPRALIRTRTQSCPKQLGPGKQARFDQLTSF